MQAREKSYEKHTENMQIKCENSFTQCAIKENAIIDVQRENKAKKHNSIQFVLKFIQVHGWSIFI